MGGNHVWGSTRIYTWVSLCDLFLIVENIDIASHADDNTPYTTGNSIEEVIQKLENASKTLFQWFNYNLMKSNTDKCNFLCSSSSEVSLTIESQKTKNSKFKKLLGIELDSKLSFTSHIHLSKSRTETKCNI